ncbi:MAG: alpha/beta hydrolase [Acholeplasmataceae bacterium]|nr:alpha/beta hydrolase [Acholeplasmataceae bacterium]
MKILVNGIELFYEKNGKGKPLIFLHGNGEDHETFNSLVKSLSEYYECYQIDSRNHGKSQKNLPLHYEDMGQDIYHFIHQLKLCKPIVFGFSDGAIIAMILASRYPDLFDKMILAGGSLNPFGVTKKLMIRMQEEYQKTNNPLIELMLNEPDIKQSDLNKIICPTLILAGENDVIKYAHTKQIHHGIHGSRLLIIKGHTHDSYIMNTYYLKEIILNFA